MSEIKQAQSTRAGSRKTGVATSKTRKVASETSTAAVTPLEVILETMNSFRAAGELEKAAALAKAAAPYIHPKLTAVEHTGKDGGDIVTVTRIELVAASVDSAN